MDSFLETLSEFSELETCIPDTHLKNLSLIDPVACFKFSYVTGQTLKHCRLAPALALRRWKRS